MATQVTLNPATPRSSLRAAYAKSILHKHLLARLNKNKRSNEKHKSLPKAPDVPPVENPYTGNICIIGAGVAGLYTAMMLEAVGITNITILEANSRVGGRCFTQRVSEDQGIDEYHNYYDIGAMRIPDIPWMQQVINFIDFLGLRAQRQEYVYTNPAVPYSYWYRNAPISDDRFDTYMMSIVAYFETNFNDAFEKWLGTDKDNYSTRAMLMVGPEGEAPDPHFTYDETAYAEIYDTSTGLFDQSFTETVIDYADFGAARSKPWWRIDGGMQTLTDTMQRKLASGSKPIIVKTNSPVVALSNNEATKKIKVTVAGKDPVDFDMVFNTTAMGPLKQMDLQGLGLADNILTGIRSLSYDRATKVAIRFRTPWWADVLKTKGEPYGGVSSSDLPISNVVYPSWDDGPNNEAVLMVSYAWAQDATRIASLIPDYTLVKPTKNDPIVTLCFKNLVKLWAGQKNAPDFKYLYNNYVSHHAWAWQHDPWTGGAFALFGPGQFKNVYNDFNALFCGNKLALCGEALSAHHAWITGAMDSAYINVYRFLHAHGRSKEKQKLLESIFGGGKGKHAEEMDENLVKWSVHFSKGGVSDDESNELRSGREEAKGLK